MYQSYCQRSHRWKLDAREFYSTELLSASQTLQVTNQKLTTIEALSIVRSLQEQCPNDKVNHVII